MVRVTAKSASNQQVSASRAIREQVKTAFDREGIRVPVMMRYPGQGPGAAPGGPGP